MSYVSGCFVDRIIGTLQKDTITTIFGPPGSGKTTLTFMYAVNCINLGKKVIYIDTEGGFSVERLKQINDEVDLTNLIVFSAKSFEQQQKIIINLNKEIKNSKNIGLVIVDSLVMLYRLKLGDDPQRINSELGEQLRLLTEISRNFEIPILVTNQMYKDFETKKSKMVGGNLIEYWSKTILEFDSENDIKFIKLRKHKFIGGNNKVNFKIDNSGLVEIKHRSFNLF